MLCGGSLAGTGSVSRLAFSVVVMGAISRRSGASAFIGSTAERVIDQLRCDILVVKSAEFATDVSAKPALRIG